MLTIAYLGPEKTNTHIAAQARFGRHARYLHAPTVEDVFRLVEREGADYGVVPIENSLEGAVTHTLDRFIDFKHSPIQIHGEIKQPIQHYLISYPNSYLRSIAIVLSHPQALAQCRIWLQKHLPDAELCETTSTSEAVMMLTQKGMLQTQLRAWASPDRRYRAAIGRREIAQELGLRAIPIPQDKENITRFLILRLGFSPRGAHNKTAIFFALKDKPGALHNALMPFKRNRINLTKIESRPSKRKAWEYLFFIDFEGHVSEPRVKRALRSLERSTTLLRVLGSYPMMR